MYPLRQDQYLTQGCTLAPPLSLHPLPSLISNCLNLPLGTQGSSGRLECVTYKRETGDTEGLLCLGAHRALLSFNM